MCRSAMSSGGRRRRPDSHAINRVLLDRLGRDVDGSSRAPG
jgi:hypothetical protein